MSIYIISSFSISQDQREKTPIHLTHPSAHWGSVPCSLAQVYGVPDPLENVQSLHSSIQHSFRKASCLFYHQFLHSLCVDFGMVTSNFPIYFRKKSHLAVWTRTIFPTAENRWIVSLLIHFPFPHLLLLNLLFCLQLQQLFFWKWGCL